MGNRRSAGWPDEELLEKRWLVERACVQHEIKGLEIDDVLGEKQLEQLRSIGVRLGLFSESWPSYSTAAFFSANRRWGEAVRSS